MKKFDPTLYFITDSSFLPEEEFLERVEKAILGGATLVQLREKEKSTIDYIDLAEKVHKITKKYKVPLIIDDRVDVCLAINAEGVHLGSSDMPINTARKILGEDKIIGATAKTIEKALKAQNMGADYIGCGAIYPTTTKVKTVLTPIKTLKDICKEVDIPVNAIGGLNISNLDVLKDTGIKGICVVSAVMKAKDPEIAAKELKIKAKELIGEKL